MSVSTDYRAVADEAAQRAGVPVEMFRRQIQQESGFNPNAYNADSDATGIAQIVPRWHPDVDPRDPIASLWYAARLMAGYHARFGSWAKALAAFNWGSGNVGGYTTAGGVVVPPWDGRRETLPGETRQYLDVILGPGWPEPAASGVTDSATNRVAFNRDAPVDPQPDDFSCSIQSAQWLLRSIGRDPKRGWLEQQLLSGRLVTRELGLMDASGRQVAAWLQTEYGNEMGLTFAAQAVNSWDDLVALAGKGPLMLGGRGWNHWTGVREYRDGKIMLANPAGSWRGVGQELTRDEFDALGSWSAVTVTQPSAGVGNGPAATNDEDTILGLRVAIAHLVDKVLPRAAAAAAEREAALAEANRIRLEFVGPKPAA